ncbi:hypothetical protein SOMG_01753 [Schizosaccharomyces osmophilus]|uniref:Uncharacterized protein n=1 Tax=Schizosaccharomyces osmophilus TaxID=2545709 RepID=A0AAE9W8U4_9SCHI|nr:uncharacterized protein SOMG_01753 [Schizosaccharomyces osmophilus]WBW71349.1 hypothetical protein SOMG_01753 [Schizosaccharomyces osmophilus]
MLFISVPKTQINTHHITEYDILDPVNVTCAYELGMPKLMDNFTSPNASIQLNVWRLSLRIASGKFERSRALSRIRKSFDLD